MSRIPKGKVRVDVALVERGLAESRTRAQALVMAGSVRIGEQRIDKPGSLIDIEAELTVAVEMPFVSRGGMKLASALDAFGNMGLDVSGRTAVDVGASTGGFTDCLLSRGAMKVYAVDVGFGQLADKLRRDARVVCRERTNARYLGPEDFSEPIDLVVVDASFIGLGKLAPALARILRPGGALVALVKPQFEAGREAVTRGKGVIRDPMLRDEAIAAARESIEKEGFRVQAEADSAVAGPKGNVERFVYAIRSSKAKAEAFAE